MTTVTQAARLLGLKRDQLHNEIRKLKQQGLLLPTKEGNRFILSNTDLNLLRNHLRANKKPIGAIVAAQITGADVRDAVDQVMDKCPEVVWCAGAWGEQSLIALVEVTKFDEIGRILVEMQKQAHLVSTTTHVTLREYYSERDVTPDRTELAFVLLAIESANLIEYVIHKLGEIEGVKRYGAILGIPDGDAFAEVRYRNATDLEDIVIRQIHHITGVKNTRSILTMSDQYRRDREQIKDEPEP